MRKSGPDTFEVGVRKPRRCVNMLNAFWRNRLGQDEATNGDIGPEVRRLSRADDEATAELMKKFYEGVLRNGQRPGEALRAAQMWMLQQPRWKAPHYWAGFILQGEWK